MYDYFLGGSHNFAVDREMAEQVLASIPDIKMTMRENRAFLRRVVSHLAGAGVRQFLDIGSGIPTAGNVHEVVGVLAADARVCYVDIDPVAIAHSKALLAGNPNADIVRGDVRSPAAILADPRVNKLIDFTLPVAVLLVSVLHFLPDSDDLPGIVARLRDAVPPGSYLAIAHGTSQSRPDEGAQLEQLYRRTTNPITSRGREQILALFEGFELVDPGVVWAPQWHPDSPEDVGEHAERSSVLVGLGHKPGGGTPGSDRVRLRSCPAQIASGSDRIRLRSCPDRGHSGSSNNFPVVRRAARSSWARAASASG